MSDICQCIKKDGNRCSRTVKLGSKYCWQHQDCKQPIKVKSPIPKVPKSKPPTPKIITPKPKLLVGTSGYQYEEKSKLRPTLP